MANVLLISYDNDAHIPFFPQNLFYLASALWSKGHAVEPYLMDIHHGITEGITTVIDILDVDVVGLGFVAGYYQYRKAKEISDAVNKSKHRKKFNYVLGGHGPAAEPDFFLAKMGADTVVIGDGERSICACADKNQKGIIQGEPWEKEKDYSGYYAQFPIHIYRLIRFPTSTRTAFCFPILSSRGCKWHCSFCYRMREGFYERPIEAIIEEIKFLYRTYQINHFQFSDELLMSSEKRTEDICEALLKLNFKLKWDCNGRLNYSYPKLLQLMKQSGCEYVNYGIESLDQKILNQMGKGLAVEQIHNGVRSTLEAGLSPGLNLLWGFPGDTVQNLQNSVDFIKKYDPCHELRTIRPVTPYPGCPLYKKAIEMGLIKNAEDFYENLHKNSDLFTVNFMDIPTEKAHQCLYSANVELINNYKTKNEKRLIGQAQRLYLEGNPDFRGWRAV